MKSSKRRTISKIPDDEIIIGKIYANWCGHCKNMGDEFRQIGNIVMTKKNASGGSNHNKKIQFIEIPEHQKDEKIAELNKRYFHGKEKVKCEGYPTVFKISGGSISYYNGNTNFIDQLEGEENKRKFQDWVEKDIYEPKASSQRGGGCSAASSAAKNQKGGWRWSTKKSKSTKNKKITLKRTSSRSRSRSTRNFAESKT